MLINRYIVLLLSHCYFNEHSCIWFDDVAARQVAFRSQHIILINIFLPMFFVFVHFMPL